MEKIDIEEKEISSSYKSKEILKGIIASTLILGGICAVIIIILWCIQFDTDEVWIQEVFLIITIILSIFAFLIPWIVINLLNLIYILYYIKNFSYKLTNSNIELKHGILTKKRVTIPYSRVQNINIVHGLFDRIYGLYTVKIETAGATAVGRAAQGFGRPEGYIPGLKDPFAFEKQLKQMLDKYNVLPSGLEDKIFKPQELAFDNFISYILTKLRDKDDLLKNSIKDLRENQNLSMMDLAEKVGVKKETIEQLESGRYTPSLSLAYKIAKELKVRIEDLFKF